MDLIQFINRLKKENESLKEDVERLKNELRAAKEGLKNKGAIVQQIAQQDNDLLENKKVSDKSPVPKIAGWSIVKIKPKNPKHSAMYHAKRKIKGKVFTAYIGTHLDADKTVKKIRAKERELGKRGYKLSDQQKRSSQRK